MPNHGWLLPPLTKSEMSSREGPRRKSGPLVGSSASTSRHRRRFRGRMLRDTRDSATGRAPLTQYELRTPLPLHLVGSRGRRAAVSIEDVRPQMLHRSPAQRHDLSEHRRVECQHSRRLRLPRATVVA